MGREIRRVPKGWEHPKNERGHYKPLYDDDYGSAAEEWLENLREWEAGEDPDRAEYEAKAGNRRYYWEWNGNPPDREYYRPKWGEGEATHCQIYENVSEGTPISPVFESTEEMLGWLLAQGHSEKASQCFIRDGFAFSMAFIPGVGLIQGIETAGLGRDCTETPGQPEPK